MTSIRNDLLIPQNHYDEQLCKKISVAIKKSNLFTSLNLPDLIRKRLNGTQLNTLEDVPQAKMHKDIPNFEDSVTENGTNKDVNSIIPDSSSSATKAINLQSTDKLKPITIKSECVVKGDFETDRSIFLVKFNKDPVHISENITSIKPVIMGNNKLNVSDSREKQNKDLSNLATSLLPLPTHLFGKHSMMLALETGQYSDFIKFLKEGIQVENEITPDDLTELIDTLIEKKALFLIPNFLNCIKNINSYIEVLVNSFIHHKSEMINYHNDVIDCIESMIDYKTESNINTFVKACAEVLSWDKMWLAILKNKLDYKMPLTYFNASMEIFQNLKTQKPSIKTETLTYLISYITRNYPSKKTTLMVDIWFYCIYYDITNNDLNSLMDYEFPQNTVDKILDKLSTMNDVSFVFGMKLLSKSWILIFNHSFCEWFSKLISDKSDVRKCLYTIKDSIHVFKTNKKQQIFDNFYLLAIRVMSYLNKKSLFTCSKNVFENFLKNNFIDIKRALTNVDDKFKLKWTMVECLISSAEYEKALSVIKEFEVLKDLEATCEDYYRVKEILPNLVWRLLNSLHMLPVIVLFEEVISIFIFNENIDSAYTKNCNEIFDLIVIKAYESNDIEVVKKMISLFDLILSADIDFEISKESLRYLAVAAVRTNVSFKELLDFVDTCFKFNVFENIQTAEDGFGSFVNASANLTHEEIVLLITWMCRHVKINLIETAQNQSSSIRENIMKVCSIRFILRPSETSDSFCSDIGVNMSFGEFFVKFSEALNNPKYLAHPIKFSITNDSTSSCDSELTIVCDSRMVYNTIYYSDI